MKVIRSELKTFVHKDKTWHVYCQLAETRTGFSHICTLHTEKGAEVAKQTSKYQNRTWESHEFYSCIQRLLSEHFKDEINVEHLWANQN